MFKGRLGLETARIPHADRAGLLWLSRGALTARDGTLSFERGSQLAENDPLGPGHYAIPFQGVSMILLGPGSTVSHDALRLLARHGTALAAVGEDGVRCYTAPPLIPDRSGLARRQARAWGGHERASPDRSSDVRLAPRRGASARRHLGVARHRGRQDEGNLSSGGAADWNHLAGTALRPCPADGDRPTKPGAEPCGERS